MDWSPNVSIPQAAKPAAQESAASTGGASDLDAQIKQCGDKVRDLKLNKAAKVEEEFNLCPLFFMLFNHFIAISK